MMPDELVCVYYSPHDLVFLTNDFLELLRKSQILVVEAAQPSRLPLNYEIDFNKLCRGESSPSSMMSRYPNNDPIMIKLYEWLHRTSKRIVFEKSPITDSDIMEVTRLETEAISWEIRDKKTAIMIKRSALEKFAKTNNRRDAAMAKLIRGITNSNPNTRVLVWRGLAHRRRFGIELKANSVPHETIVASNCAMFPLSVIAERLANGGEVSDSEIESVLTEKIFPPWILFL